MVIAYMPFKAVSWPMSVGIVPVRLFSVNDNWVRAVILAKKDGTVPEIRL